MSSICKFIILAGFIWIPCLRCASAQEAQDGNSARGGVWWDWNVKRGWSNNHRLARGTIKLYADVEKTKPITAELLRYSLELDCPLSSGRELQVKETSGASQINAEVRCAFGGDGRFEVRWQFEATDPRFGTVSDKGSLSK